MFVTRQTDYALRCVLYLSRGEDRIASVGEISRAMHVPKSFLAKILQRLVKSEIVTSTRGVRGGFQLAKRPRDISLLDVIEAVQGPTAMNMCSVDRKTCRLSGTCAIHPVWAKLRRDIEERLKKERFSDFPGRG
jgi:Rrf2 family protein